MYCPKCAHLNNDNSKFCEFCGARLAAAPEATAAENTAAAEAVVIEPVSESSVNETAAETPMGEAAVAGAAVAGTAEAQSEAQPYAGAPVQPRVVPAPQPNAGGTIYYSAPAQAGTRGSGFSITSLVCSILSFVCCMVPVVGIILGIVAIVFGILGLKSTQRGMAIAGIIVGGAGLLISVFVLVVAIASGAFEIFYNILGNEYRI